MIGGNTNIIAGSEYNDLEAEYIANVGYDSTLQYKYATGDSGQLKSTTDDGEIWLQFV